MDTIFALATSPQPSPVAFIRVSGPLCREIARRALQVDFARNGFPATLSLPLGQVPSRVWLAAAPHTFTGDDTLELRVPGNPRLVAALEPWLVTQGCRQAEPGEFTRRALAAGKLDLSRAEAVSALINAQSEAQWRQALADLRGETANRLAEQAECLRALSAAYEVAFDFSEDETESAPLETLGARLQRLTADLDALCSNVPARPRRELPVVALFGLPNAGKSSLFNALLGKRRALVSDTPGTTRDPVRATLELGAFSAELVDLSGVGTSDADAGRFSARAEAEALGADLLLLVCAPGQASELAREFSGLVERQPDLPARCLWVNTMQDLQAATDSASFSLEACRVSALTGSGTHELAQLVRSRLTAAAGGGTVSQLRVGALQALDTLKAACAGFAKDPPEATAALVRKALRQLDEALLAQAPGEVLDLIFSRFCIGK